VSRGDKGLDDECTRWDDGRAEKEAMAVDVEVAVRYVPEGALFWPLLTKEYE